MDPRELSLGEDAFLDGTRGVSREIDGSTAEFQSFIVAFVHRLMMVQLSL